MIIGVPKEIKPFEYRVALSPEGVQTLVNAGHTVLIEKGVGEGSLFFDQEYISYGATICSKEEMFKKADFIYKVKELFPEEFNLLREDLIVMTYFHSNAHKDETDACLEKKIIGISYEDIQDKNGKFPLLRPMSEVAGKGGFIAACHFAQNISGGPGIMLSRVTGVSTPNIMIIGAGAAGLGAAELASAFGNKVTILDINPDEMLSAKASLPINVEFLYSDSANIKKCLKTADVLINCISWPKWRTDHLVSKGDLRLMKSGAIIIDVACDDGGAIETCKSTTHKDPIYFEEGILHYCVDNIPSAYAKTASQSLSSSTLPYVMEIAQKGVKKALEDNAYLRKGLSFYKGKLTLEETGRKQKREYCTPEDAMNI